MTSDNPRLTSPHDLPMTSTTKGLQCHWTSPHPLVPMPSHNPRLTVSLNWPLPSSPLDLPMNDLPQSKAYHVTRWPLPSSPRNLPMKDFPQFKAYQATRWPLPSSPHDLPMNDLPQSKAYRVTEPGVTLRPPGTLLLLDQPAYGWQFRLHSFLHAGSCTKQAQGVKIDPTSTEQKTGQASCIACRELHTTSTRGQNQLISTEQKHRTGDRMPCWVQLRRWGTGSVPHW